jgi:2-aminoadipate transaminase
MNIFRLNHLNMKGVKLENNGVNIEKFKKVLKRQN